MTNTDTKQGMTDVERPDDSGEFDDETLEQIIREAFDSDCDGQVRRDGRWIFSRLDARDAEILALKTRIEELEKMRDELARYVRHAAERHCPTAKHPYDPCTCGLTALLARIR